jgi:hypothetical protein
VKSGADIGLLDGENLKGVLEDGRLSFEPLDSIEEDLSLGDADVVGNLNIDAHF